MNIVIEIADDVLASTIRDLLVDRGLLREALEKVFAREKLTDLLTKAISKKADELLATTVNGAAFVDTLKLAVADSVEEAIAKTIELVGEERIKELARASTKGI